MVAKKDFLKFNKKYLVIKQLHDYMYIYIYSKQYICIHVNQFPSICTFINWSHYPHLPERLSASPKLWGSTPHVLQNSGSVEIRPISFDQDVTKWFLHQMIREYIYIYIYHVLNNEKYMLHTYRFIFIMRLINIQIYIYIYKSTFQVLLKHCNTVWLLSHWYRVKPAGPKYPQMMLLSRRCFSKFQSLTFTNDSSEKNESTFP